MSETTSDPAGGAAEGAGPGADRRTVIKAAAATGVAAATSLRGFSFLKSAQAATAGPVKVGFIEDESGNLSVYGLQKLHAAQLAVKEINDGKMLKGGPVGAGGMGAEGSFAGTAPTIGITGTTLPVVNDGGSKDKKD